MIKRALIALLLVGGIYATAHLWLCWRGETILLRTNASELEVSLPAGTCQPTNAEFEQQARQQFAAADTASRLNLSIAGVFVSCAALSADTPSHRVYPWGVFAFYTDNDGMDAEAVSQRYINAVLQARLEFPETVMMAEENQAATGVLNEIATSTLLAAGIFPSGGLLGEAQQGARTVVSDFSAMIGIVSSQQLATIDGQDRRVRVSVGVTKYRSTVLSILLFGTSDTTTHAQDVATLSAFARRLHGRGG